MSTETNTSNINKGMKQIKRRRSGQVHQVHNGGHTPFLLTAVPLTKYNGEIVSDAFHYGRVTDIIKGAVSSIRCQLACVYTDDSNQLSHLHNLIRVLVFHLKKLWTFGYP